MNCFIGCYHIISRRFNGHFFPKQSISLSSQTLLNNSFEFFSRSDVFAYSFVYRISLSFVEQNNLSIFITSFLFSRYLYVTARTNVCQQVVLNFHIFHTYRLMARHSIPLENESSILSMCFRTVIILRISNKCIYILMNTV